MDPNRSKNLLKPKPELFDYDFPSPTQLNSTHQLGDNVASSSRSNVRYFFTEMGYPPPLVDRVIEENGDENVDLLLEILMECSDLQKPNSHSSDSLDGLFDDKGASSPPECSKVADVKEEPDVFDEVYDDKRASLLKMNFSAKEVEFAMAKLGEDAPIGEIVDFIIAAQIAENVDRQTDDFPDIDAQKKEDINDETLYETMEKTLCLLEMGFSANEISLVIDKFGSEVPIAELADAICALQRGEPYVIKKKAQHSVECSRVNIEKENEPRHCFYGRVKTEIEECNRDALLRSQDLNIDEIRKGKRPRQDSVEGYQDAQFRHVGFQGNYEDKWPKQEYDSSDYCFEPEWVEEKFDPNRITTTFGMPMPFTPHSRVIDQIAAKPPYFFYGNVATASSDAWRKVSQFLYGVQPEFINAQFFSALNRKEGNVHNLPIENRFHILPKPPITIDNVMPHTKKWWPMWDTRKKLCCINFETSRSSELCDMLGKMLTNSRGLLSAEQQRDLLRHCQTSNLTWVGPNKLAPMEPVHLEQILGYPLNHTLIADISLSERLRLLGYCFQTDTLGYILSVLKLMFPEGITVLSLFSGIGGAEVALHRLGIHLKGVVSVEASEINRRILKRWWHSTGQVGQLEQIDDIQKLTSNVIERLVENFGCFDFVICQNAFTQCSKIPKIGSNRESHPVFDFSLFNEFVRVLQRVRSMAERKR